MKGYFLAKALGITEEEMEAAFRKAARLGESFRPDGKNEYVPLTREYASRNPIGRKTLRRLEGE